MKEFLSLLVRLTRCTGARDFCPALAALVVPDQNIFSPTIHFFSSFFPIAQQAGQAVVLGRLCVSSINISPLGPGICDIRIHLNFRNDAVETFKSQEYVLHNSTICSFSQCPLNITRRMPHNK
jgi:hypothetical protein